MHGSYDVRIHEGFAIDQRTEYDTYEEEPHRNQDRHGSYDIRVQEGAEIENITEYESHSGGTESWADESARADDERRRREASRQHGRPGGLPNLGTYTKRF